MTRSVIVRVVWLAGIGFFLGIGLWAFFAPRSFFDALASYPPFNAHLLRDAGAFQIGIGAGLVAAARWRDGLTTALIATAAGALSHAVSHVIDAGTGGRPTDPWLLSLFAVFVTAGAFARTKEVGT